MRNTVIDVKVKYFICICLCSVYVVIDCVTYPTKKWLIDFKAFNWSFSVLVLYFIQDQAPPHSTPATSISILNINFISQEYYNSWHVEIYSHDFGESGYNF